MNWLLLVAIGMTCVVVPGLLFWLNYRNRMVHRTEDAAMKRHIQRNY